MLAVVQRVAEASVSVDQQCVGRIGQGLLVLVGIGRDDQESDAILLAEKTVHLRIFQDEAGQMNRSVLDVGGGVLAVSQFTLWGNCRKGRRPSFVAAAPPELAERLYEHYVTALEARGVLTETGRFGANMQVELINDGPVTLWLDTQQLMRPKGNNK